LPKPTVHRIRRSLRDLGSLEASGARASFGLSERLAPLRAHGRDVALITKVQPWMEAWRGVFDETVNLGGLEGISVHYGMWKKLTRLCAGS